MASEYVRAVFKEIDDARKIWEDARPKMFRIAMLAGEMEFRNRSTELFRAPMEAHAAMVQKIGHSCLKGHKVWTKFELILRAGTLLFESADENVKREIRRLQQQIEEL